LVEAEIALEVIIMRLVTISAVVMLTSFAQAQDMAPANVNDCTLLTDPTQLHDCIDSFERRGTQTTSPEGRISDVDPKATGSVVTIPEVATRDRFQRRNPRVHRPKAPLSGSEKTRIQQIER
jgi:hypothetical protein